MGYSAWLVSRRGWSLPTQALYYSQLLLNLAWQPSFFNFHKLTTAFNVIAGPMLRIYRASKCSSKHCCSAIAMPQILIYGVNGLHDG